MLICVVCVGTVSKFEDVDGVVPGAVPIQGCTGCRRVALAGYRCMRQERSGEQARYYPRAYLIHFYGPFDDEAVGACAPHAFPSE